MVSIAVAEYYSFTIVCLVLCSSICRFVLFWCVTMVVLVCGVEGLFVSVRFIGVGGGFQFC